MTGTVKTFIALTLHAVFRLLLRQTEGLIGSIFQLLGLDLAVPDLSVDERQRILAHFGALPAFLCVFIQMRLKEPEKWVKARAEGRAGR